MNSNLLAGDVALITGAARGIGAAIARALAREGAKVFLTDIAGREVESVARSIIRSSLRSSQA